MTTENCANVPKLVLKDFCAKCPVFQCNSQPPDVDIAIGDATKKSLGQKAERLTCN